MAFAAFGALENKDEVRQKVNEIVDSMNRLQELLGDSVEVHSFLSCPVRENNEAN